MKSGQVRSTSPSPFLSLSLSLSPLSPQAVHPRRLRGQVLGQQRRVHSPVQLIQASNQDPRLHVRRHHGAQGCGDLPHLGRGLLELEVRGQLVRQRTLVL